jgi:MYXO-CTERM domain-containing protein
MEVLQVLREHGVVLRPFFLPLLFLSFPCVCTPAWKKRKACVAREINEYTHSCERPSTFHPLSPLFFAYASLVSKEPCFLLFLLGLAAPFLFRRRRHPPPPHTHTHARAHLALFFLFGSCASARAALTDLPESLGQLAVLAELKFSESLCVDGAARDTGPADSADDTESQPSVPR